MNIWSSTTRRTAIFWSVNSYNYIQYRCGPQFTQGAMLLCAIVFAKYAPWWPSFPWPSPTFGWQNDSRVKFLQRFSTLVAYPKCGQLYYSSIREKKLVPEPKCTCLEQQPVSLQYWRDLRNLPSAKRSNQIYPSCLLKHIKYPHATYTTYTSQRYKAERR